MLQPLTATAAYDGARIVACVNALAGIDDPAAFRAESDFLRLSLAAENDRLSRNELLERQNAELLHNSRAAKTMLGLVQSNLDAGATASQSTNLRFAICLLSEAISSCSGVATSPGVVGDLADAVSGLHGALSRMIDKHDPDSIEAEWLSHSHEAVRSAQGGDLEMYKGLLAAEQEDCQLERKAKNDTWERAEELRRQRDELKSLLEESEVSIGGDWRNRRDSLLAKCKGGS
jgi:hypothetical protein